MKPMLLQCRRDLLIAALLFAGSLAVYLRTLCPTIYWGDCGELVTAVYQLGVTHPTGYPVWCLLGKLWTLLLPIGSIVWRLSTMSAFFGALAVAVFYGFGRAISLPRSIAVAAAGLFAVSHTFWQQCLFAETYSMAAFYTCLCLFLAARWRARGCRPSDLTLLAVAYGFAMTHHQTNALFLPGYVAFLLWTQPALLHWRDRRIRKQWATTLGAGLLPLVFYAYLPIRSLAHPPGTWGDQTTLFGFLYHITGRSYAELMFHTGHREILHNLVLWGARLNAECPWPMAAASVLGCAVLWRRADQRPLALLLSWLLAADVFFTVNYRVYNAYIYFIPSYIALLAFAGAGVRGIWQRIEAAADATRTPAYAQIGALCIVLLVPIQAVGNWHTDDLSRNWTCYDYGRNLLSSMPPHGIVIPNGGDTELSAMDYLQNVENYRPDVIVIKRGILQVLYDRHYKRWANIWYLKQIIHAYPELRRYFAIEHLTVHDTDREALLENLIRNGLRDGRAVCVVEPSRAHPLIVGPGRGYLITFDSYLNHNFASAQIGLELRLYLRGKRPPDRALLAETQQVWRNYSVRGVFDGMYLGDDYLTPIALDYADGLLARARLAYATGDYADAQTAYEKVGKLFRSDEAAQGIKRCAAALSTAEAHPRALPQKPDRFAMQRG